MADIGYIALVIGFVLSLYAIVGQLLGKRLGHGSLSEDLYIILAGWEKDGRATLKVLINPLMAWLWIGSYVMVAGTIFALWPGRGAEIGPKYIKGGWGA